MKKTLLVATLIAAGITAHADPLKVATGDFKTGTYPQVFREFTAVCNSVPTVQVETNGSITNVDLLVTNKVNMAIVQTDVLFFRAQTEDLSNIKTLANLYPETIHLIARGDVKKEGGFLGFGGKEIKFNTPQDLAGRNVGAVGGSTITAKIIAAQSGINYNVVQFPNNDALKEALLSGKVDAIVVVGGAPHKMVETLDRQYKLLAFSPDLQNKLSKVYSASRVSYNNLDQRGVSTVSTDAAIVTRTYRSANMNKQLSDIKTCFHDKLGDIQDTTGTHPAWQQIKLSNVGKWPQFDTVK